MNVRRPILIGLLALAGAAALIAAQAASLPVDPGALAHCASMTGADERLACYDSLSHPRSNAAPAAPAASAKAAPQAPAAPAASVNTAPAAAAVAGGAAAGAASSAPEAKNFGLMPHPAPTEEGPSQIQAKVTRIDADRWGHVRLSLDNGQAWTFDSMNPPVREGEAVTIRRGVIGSFLLTTASHQTYRTERAQ